MGPLDGIQRGTTNISFSIRRSIRFYWLTILPQAALQCHCKSVGGGGAFGAHARQRHERGGLQWHEQNWKSVRLGLSVYAVKKSQQPDCIIPDSNDSMRQLCQQILEFLELR